MRNWSQATVGNIFSDKARGVPDLLTSRSSGPGYTLHMYSNLYHIRNSIAFVVDGDRPHHGKPDFLW